VGQFRILTGFPCDCSPPTLPPWPGGSAARARPGRGRPGRDKLQQAFDAGYTADFNRKIGLDIEGRPPTGATFISRAMPAGTAVRAYRPGEATVDVWCSGPFGLSGKGVRQIPIKSSWFTMTVTVRAGPPTAGG
jgi:hypothetical protein